MPTHEGEKTSRRLYLLALLAVAALGGVTLAYGVNNWVAEQRARRLPNPVAPTKENFEAGRKIYIDHCVDCHGDRGDGKGQKSAQLSVEPGDFTDAHKMRGLTDGDLYWRITKGRNPMPGFEDKLTILARWQAVNYIRGFAHPANADRPLPLPPTRSPQPSN